MSQALYQGSEVKKEDPFIGGLDEINTSTTGGHHFASDGAPRISAKYDSAAIKRLEWQLGVFIDAADRTFRLLQADTIEKKDSGYYESLGRTEFNVTNDVTNNVSSTTTYDHRVGSFDTISGGDGAQIEAHSSTALGSLNNSHTAIAIEGEDNSCDR